MKRGRFCCKVKAAKYPEVARREARIRGKRGAASVCLHANSIFNTNLIKCNVLEPEKSG